MKKEKICFICYIIASICFYLSALIGICSHNGGNWVVNLCLGSAFLCLASTHREKKEEKKTKGESQK